jgi:hypothetical protein
MSIVFFFAKTIKGLREKFMKNEMFLRLLDQRQWGKANSPLSQSEEQKIVLRATQHLHCHSHRTKGLPESLLVTVLISFETRSIWYQISYEKQREPGGEKKKTRKKKTMIERNHRGGRTSLSDRSVLTVAEGGATSRRDRSVLTVAEGGALALGGCTPEPPSRAYL